MKIGKYNITKYTANSIYHRHIRPIWDPRLRGNDDWVKRFTIITNNFCNLSCWSCSALCNTPMGSNPFRFEKHVTPIDSYSKFLDLVDGYMPENWIRLSGGEPTLCPPEYLKEICELAHQHNRNVSLLSNAAGMSKLDPNWFDFIHLDEHIINQKTIYDTAKRFKDMGYSRYQILTTKVHRDLQYQREGNVTQGLQCEAWLTAISLWRDTVYPCCVLPFLDGWNNDEKIRLALYNNGWNIHNPNLVSVIENYKQTTPPEIVHACVLKCWHGGTNIKYHPVSG